MKTTRPKHLTLRPAEVPRLLRPSGLVVLPVKPRPLLPPRDKYPTMYDARVASALKLCPLGGPGTQWVGREKWFPCSTFDPSEETGAIYRADAWRNGNEPSVKWQPARIMPNWASRIRKTTTRVELRRVRTITEAEAIEAGFEAGYYRSCGLNIPVSALSEFVTEFNARYPGAWDRDDYAWFVFYTDTLGKD